MTKRTAGQEADERTRADASARAAEGSAETADSAEPETADGDDSEIVASDGPDATDDRPQTDETTAEGAAGEDSCQNCGGTTIPGSDECPHCGAVVDAGEGPSLETWGWAGGILAGFGIFLTPILAGPPALYCAWKIREWKPQTARYIVIAVGLTVVFWLFFYPLIYISATV